MTTRRQSMALAQSGINPDDSLRQQYQQQNQAIIAKNIELTKTNAGLSTQLRTAKYEEIVLRQEVLLLKRKSFEDETKINDLLSTLDLTQSKLKVAEQSQSGNSDDEEVKRQMLANMLEALLGIQHLLVPSTPPSVAPASPAPSLSPAGPSTSAGQFENVTVARRRSVNRAPRPSITTRPNLANISEGEISVEQEQEEFVQAHQEIAEEPESGSEEEFQSPPRQLHSPIAEPVASTSQLSPPAQAISVPLVKPVRVVKAPPTALSATAAASINSLVDSRRPARRPSGIMKSTALPIDSIPPAILEPPLRNFTPILTSDLTHPKSRVVVESAMHLPTASTNSKVSSRRSSVVASLGKKVTVGASMAGNTIVKEAVVGKEVQVTGERELWKKQKTTIYSSESEEEREDEVVAAPVRKPIAGRRQSMALKQKEMVESEEEEEQSEEAPIEEEKSAEHTDYEEKPIQRPKTIVKSTSALARPILKEKVADTPPKRSTKNHSMEENQMLPPPPPQPKPIPKVIRPAEVEPVLEGRRSRKSSVVSYTQPKLNTKMRRPDKNDLSAH